MRLTLLMYLLLTIGAKAQNPSSKRADSLYQIGNYRAAINAYSELGTPRASLQIARAYKTSGLNAKAVEQYKDLVQKHPEQKIACFELGKLYFQLGRFPAAAAVFQNLLKEEKDPNTNPEYAYYLGRVYQEQDNYQPAFITYARALQADSTHVRSLYQVSRMYLGLKENDSVFKYTAKGLQYAQDDRGLINLRAQAFFNEPRYEEAIPLFEELLKQGAEKEFILKKLAYSYFSTRKLLTVA